MFQLGKIRNVSACKLNLHLLLWLTLWQLVLIWQKKLSSCNDWYYMLYDNWQCQDGHRPKIYTLRYADYVVLACFAENISSIIKRPMWLFNPYSSAHVISCWNTCMIEKLARNLTTRGHNTRFCAELWALLYSISHEISIRLLTISCWA